MRWMILLAAISGCAWTNAATVKAQKRDEAERANPALREQRLAQESEQNRREHARLAAGLAGFSERPAPAPAEKKRMKCTQDQGYPGMPGELHCVEE